MLKRAEKELLHKIALVTDDERVAPALARLVEAHRAENPGDRGVTRQHKLVLKRELLAAGDAKTYPDGNIRHEAKVLLRSVLNENFEEVERRCKRYFGLRRKATRRHNETRKRQQAWRTTLSDGSELAEVPTVDSLRSVGGHLGLCVAKQDRIARTYHEALRAGESRFFTRSIEGDIVCLIEVDEETKRISELSAKSNRSVKLGSGKEGLSILEALKATADRESAFADVGAFSPYLFDGRPNARLRLVENDRRYRVDVFRDQRQVVVREQSRRRKRVRWSLFEFKAPRGKGLSEWDEVYCGGIDLGQFAALLLQPKVAAVIRRLLD